jgi:hypothetical protein
MLPSMADELEATHSPLASIHRNPELCPTSNQLIPVVSLSQSFDNDPVSKNELVEVASLSITSRFVDSEPTCNAQAAELSTPASPSHAIDNTQSNNTPFMTPVDLDFGSINAMNTEMQPDIQQAPVEPDLATVAASVIGQNNALLELLLDTDFSKTPHPEMLLSRTASPEPHDGSMLSTMTNEEIHAFISAASSRSMASQKDINSKLEAISKKVAASRLRHSRLRLSACRSTSMFSHSDTNTNASISNTRDWISQLIDDKSDSMIDHKVAVGLRSYVAESSKTVDPYETDSSLSSEEDDTADRTRSEIPKLVFADAFMLSHR